MYILCAMYCSLSLVLSRYDLFERYLPDWNFCIFVLFKSQVLLVLCFSYIYGKVMMFFYFSFLLWAPVANAPNVLQPYWLIVLPLDVPALTASLLL